MKRIFLFLILCFCTSPLYADIINERKETFNWLKNKIQEDKELREYRRFPTKLLFDANSCEMAVMTLPERALFDFKLVFIQQFKGSNPNGSWGTSLTAKGETRIFRVGQMQFSDEEIVNKINTIEQYKQAEKPDISGGFSKKKLIGIGSVTFHFFVLKAPSKIYSFSEYELPYKVSRYKKAFEHLHKLCVDPESQF